MLVHVTTKEAFEVVESHLLASFCPLYKQQEFLGKVEPLPIGFQKVAFGSLDEVLEVSLQILHVVFQFSVFFL